jgi:hypothetical protein
MAKQMAAVSEERTLLTALYLINGEQVAEGHVAPHDSDMPTMGALGTFS